MNIKFIALFTTYLIATSVSSQSIWISKFQGQTATKAIVLGDTLHVFGADFRTQFPVSYYTKLNMVGQVLFQDTLQYSKLTGVPQTWTNMVRPDQILFNKEKQQFEILLSTIDTIKNYLKIRAVGFNYPPYSRMERNFNLDTNSNYNQVYKRIFNHHYGVHTQTLYDVSQNEVGHIWSVTQIGDYNTKILKSNTTIFSNPSSTKVYRSQNVFEDQQNGKNLLIYGWEDWNSNENSQDHIYKLDTNGTLLWDCRLNDNDSTNTSYTQLAQKPNGNILAIWSDWKYGAFQPQNSSNQSQSSNWGCLIMAEIDYQTGKVLLRKSLRNILISKMERLDKEPSRNFTSNLQNKSIHRELKYVTYTNDGIVLAGDFNTTNKAYDRVPFVEPYISNKMFPFLLKIDFNGNVIWYREIDVYQEDSTCTGMEVKHITLMPDSGFLLGGSVQFKDNFSQNTPYAALLKLDKNGCFEQGCDQFDAVENVEKVNEGFAVYPNPAHDEITLTLQDAPKNAQINIYNSQGVLVKTMLWQGAKTIKINLQNFSAGIYMIAVSNANQKYYAKLQVEK